jgi:hypothetical protein
MERVLITAESGNSGKLSQTRLPQNHVLRRYYIGFREYILPRIKQFAHFL